jgi:protein-L-isoaspartate(D-aspartate) O-methyltransferase
LALRRGRDARKPCGARAEVHFLLDPGTMDPRRAQMVEVQLKRRGVTDERVLKAFLKVPREEFLPEEQAEFAYRDSPLPIAEGQTISQPYIVATTAEALRLVGTERVLEVGTGSGYAAAILSRLAKEVFTIERHRSLAQLAGERLNALAFDNVEVLHGDGTLGWPEHAPFDAIAVAAGGPEVPRALLSQLSIGGRLVIPVGPDEGSQVLTQVTRTGPDDFRTEALMNVRFVPLIGAQGWPEEERVVSAPRRVQRDTAVVKLLREAAEPVRDLEHVPLESLLERIGDARVVLLGESTHGTSEFYRMRARLTAELIERRGFDFVAVEADWPDASRIDDFVLGDRPRSKHEFTPFARFPQWMWRNREVADFVAWLRAHNQLRKDRSKRAGFHGLDLYSLFTSISVVLSYLDEIDPRAAKAARARYGLLTPWQQDPAAYGQAVLAGRYQSAEQHVVAMLKDLLARRLDYALKDGERFFDAAQNARVVANAERYYRAMYYGSAASWNQRDSHMFDTLQSLLAFYGPDSRGVVWEHNSHVGDASATDLSAQGELNLGQLCREAFGERVFIVGFGTDHGTVAAASNWGEPMQVMQVRPSHPQSFERLFHESRVPAFMLHLREPRRAEVREELLPPRLQRAIGVVYRPQTELQSHYFQASLPRQFDELIWFDETRAVTALPASHARPTDAPETYPFGL